MDISAPEYFLYGNSFSASASRKTVNLLKCKGSLRVTSVLQFRLIIGRNELVASLTQRNLPNETLEEAHWSGTGTKLAAWKWKSFIV